MDLYKKQLKVKIYSHFKNTNNSVKVIETIIAQKICHLAAMELFTKFNILILLIASAATGLPLLESADGNIDNSTLEELRASINDSHPKNL